MTDPFDELRRLRPPMDHAWADSPAGRQVLARAIDQGMRPVPDRHRVRATVLARRRGPVVAVAAIAALGGLTAFTYLASADDGGTVREVGCYERLDPQSDMTGLLSDEVAELGPVRVCAREWATLEDRPADLSNLVECVNDAGGHGVFPAEPGMTAATACGQIGWRAVA